MNAQQRTENKDVIVVGAGLAGFATAISAADCGFHVKLFERPTRSAAQRPSPVDWCGCRTTTQQRPRASRIRSGRPRRTYRPPAPSTGTSSSLTRWNDGRVRNTEGDPIEGLYATGAAAAFTASGTGYQSGYSLSRAITLAHSATKHLAEAGS